ncbi:MAG TPA: hypothetical protein HA347_02240 [Nitrosopumilus sp.]|jgi:hypothetical protein|nr:MAG: hypothetical protein ABR53_04885 [Nitrosopumilus sp. BACL13 MAG-121220-bin23]KRO31768.1 MAG: hypothetical protein ABR52_00655 [Nitrosopumilus sp. BACL13 MAG-120910-bin56]HIH99590.1 hypothetical protein [Nitrosopumilus sp.]HII04780.1 hypothetical protein [Nitrosopumilus sp.]
MIFEIKTVYSNSKYFLLSVVIFSTMLVGLLILSEYIFLEPYVVSHIPSGSEFGFVLIVMISVLSALVLPMNIFRINILKKSKQKMGSGIFGSIIGAAAGACSCGPIGFAVISTFGSVGATATAFLTNYEIPIRIIAIIILVITYFTTIKSLKSECKVNFQY